MFYERLESELSQLRADGLYKEERTIISPQSSRIHVRTVGQRQLVNLCSNNYLGLANDRRLIDAAHAALDSHGLGLASVRFICGTQDIHRALEQELAAFLGVEDAILFASCFDANGAVFEPLFGENDAIISDQLNHASLIDGIRLSKARRYRYANNDMAAVAQQLRTAESDGARDIVVVTDGVFSMDGSTANLATLRQLCDEFGALLMVDDCHATGFIGEKGRGTHEQAGVLPDILTGTFGKALGGALGGYVAGRKAIVDRLRQSARPYLFSNSLPPSIVAATREALRLVDEADALRKGLHEKAAYWREGLTKLGFDLLPGDHPIVPVMLHDAKKTQAMARALDALGVFVSGFFYPVVPKGKARIRTQITAAHSYEDLDFALDAFAKAGRDVGAIA